MTGVVVAGVGPGLGSALGGVFRGAGHPVDALAALAADRVPGVPWDMTDAAAAADAAFGPPGSVALDRCPGRP